MYNQNRILALIPARAGSKGIKNKNIVDFGGKPLLAYTIEAAKGSRYLDKIVVSTDGKAIMQVAREYGADVPFLRPKEFATDTSKTIEAVLHAVNTLEKMEEHFDTFVLLQPTLPLRTMEDIDGAIDVFFVHGEEGVASVSLVQDHPILIRSITDDGKLKNMLDVGSTMRRQDMPPYYRVNGAIFINKVDELSEETSFNDNPVPFIMERSHSIDIDTMEDLRLADMYLSWDKANG